MGASVGLHGDSWDEFRGFWGHVGALRGASMRLGGVFGAPLARLRGVLKASWGVLRTSLGRLGGVLGRLGASWERLGGALGRL